MAKKDKKKIWIIIAVIAGLLLFIQPGGVTNTVQNVQDIVDAIQVRLSGGGGPITSNPELGNPDTDFLAIRLYDINGDLIKIPETFSIVKVGAGAAIPGVYYIDYVVSVNASTDADITCKIDTITPAILDAITPKPDTLVPAGSRISWTSSRITTTGKEGTHNLAIVVSCWWFDGLTKNMLTSKTATATIIITASKAGAFDVRVDVGGIPTEYCGDTICSMIESTSGSCLIDCTVVPFTTLRTSDTQYISGSAIGWNTGTCSSLLTRYGYTNLVCWAQTDATCPTTGGAAGYNLKISTGIPGGPTWATTGTTERCLYQNATSAGKMIVAFKQAAASVGPCTLANQWGAIMYDSADSDATKVENQAASMLDARREVTCTG